MHRILVTSNCTLCPEVLELLRPVGRVDYRFPIDRTQAASIIGEYEAIMCDATIRFDCQLLSSADRLRVIATPSTGTDHLDKAALAERGIEQIDIAREYDFLERYTATAEGAWALLLAAVRRLPRDFERARRGELGQADPHWAPRQLAGQTLGIVGYGRLGRMVGQYAKAFRMPAIDLDALISGRLNGAVLSLVISLVVPQRNKRENCRSPVIEVLLWHFKIGQQHQRHT